MWNENRSMMYRGQVTGFSPAGSQASHMDAVKLESPFGVPNNMCLAESSRKRKATAMEEQASNNFSGFSESVRNNLREELASLLLRDSNGQYKVGGHQGETQGSTLEKFPNQNTQFVGHTNKQPQFGEFQLCTMNKFSMSQQIKDGNLQHVALEKRGSSCMSMKPQTVELFPLIGSDKAPLLSDQRNLAYDLACKIEASIFQSYSGATDVYLEKARGVILGLKDGVNSGLISQQRIEKSEHFTHLTTADGRASFQDLMENGSAANFKWSGQNMFINNKADVSNVAETHRGSIILETSKPLKLSGCENQNFEDGKPIGTVEVSGDSGLHNLEKHTKQDSSNERPLDRKVGDDPSQSSIDLGGPSKLPAGSAVPSSHEELWDGLLQLNTSTAVSAVAYFKSGEKVPTEDWCKTVEVKGRVRLEAFEKFLQELPRSRNRALMVISLWWKAGSSKKGLTGMKEVAKSYKEGERVGFAQLSPGIDLYVCPRSDTIITILAKYGFYKGLAAAEDNQDSLIGCVVWRRNRVPSNSFSKKSEKRKLPSTEQQIDSPSGSSVSQSAETSSPITYSQDPEVNYNAPPVIQPVGYSSPLTSEAAASESADKAKENKYFQPREDLLEMRNSITHSIPKQTQVLDPSLAIATGLSTSRLPDSGSQLDTKASISEVGVPTTHIGDPRKPSMGFESSKNLVSEPAQISQKAQQGFAAPDDDDLPEFDFSAACGIPQRLQSEAPGSSIKPQTEIIKNSCGPMFPAFPIARPVITAKQQTLQPVTIPSLPLSTHQSMPQQAKKPGEQEPKVSVLVSPEGKSLAVGEQLSKPGNTKPVMDAQNLAANPGVPQKNLWDDDDDDMPEWCPPYLESQNQSATSAVEITRPPNAPALEKVPPALPRAPYGPPSSQPPLYPFGFSHGYPPRFLAPRPVSNGLLPTPPRAVAGRVEFRPIPPFGYNVGPTFRPRPGILKQPRPASGPVNGRGWRF